MKWPWSRSAYSETLALLRQEQRRDARYRRTLYRRWKRQLDCFGILWNVCAEISEARTQEGPGSGAVTVFSALAAVQPRALLVANEVRCLCEGGFADGALSRWRSLHELDVVMSFLAKHGENAATLYLDSLHAISHKRAKTYNQSCRDLGWEEIEQEEISALAELAEEAVKRTGYKLDQDWIWAIDVFPPRVETIERKGKEGALGKHRIQFAMLEEDVGLKKMRPVVNWASQHTHAGMVEPRATLGMSEVREPFVQVGGSDSGILAPISLAAFSLWRCTSVFLHIGRDEANFQKDARPLNAIYEELKSSIVF